MCVLCEKQQSFINCIIKLIINKFNESEKIMNLYGEKVYKILSEVINIFTLFRIIFDYLLKNDAIFKCSK